MFERHDVVGSGEDHERNDTFWVRWRKNFLTGLVVVAPLYLTYWIISSFVALIDSKAERLLPSTWNPQTYVDIPGYGLIIFTLGTAILGALELPLSEITRRSLRGAACALARDLDLPPPRP